MMIVFKISPYRTLHRCLFGLIATLAIGFHQIIYSVQSIQAISSTIGNGNGMEHDVISACQMDCPHRLNLKDELDIACNSTCKIQLCQVGCHYWYLSPGSCFQVCRNGSMLKPFHHSYSTISVWLAAQDNYCALGCNHAHTVYLNSVKRLLEEEGALKAPRLKPNSLGNDSVWIEWNPLPDHDLLANITHRIEWKYVNLPSQWTVVGVKSMVRLCGLEQNEQGSACLQGLHAYTSYNFRLQWIVPSSSHVLLYSQPSQSITTLAYGVPTTACIITSCMAISSKQISVSWRAPAFPNGPIIAYSLYLKNEVTGHRIVKDIHTYRSHSLAIHNYVFNDLQPGTNYTLSIVTHNNFGEGPQCSQQVSTIDSILQTDSADDPVPEDVDGAIPDPYKLYLASIKSVARRNVDFLLEEEILYHLTDYVEHGEISGMAVHARRRLLFVADTSGSIRRISLKENSINQVLRIINGSNQPSHLSVDWLNDRLYWLEDSNRVMRSNLDGESIQPIYTGSFWSNHKPIDFKVDPYNGYLFWLQANMFNRSALYRIDLYYLSAHSADVAMASGSSSLRSKIELIYQSDSWISTFTIDYHHYRLLFPMTHTAAIHSITIDGNDESTVRDNTNGQWQSSWGESHGGHMVHIENMVIYNQRLYLSSGENISWEEYHPDEHIFYMNTHTTDSKLVEMAVMDQQSQPIPIPLTPVQNVGAVFLDTSAKIYWQKPALFGASGRGAWQQWRYEVAIQESADAQVVHFAQVNNVTYCDAVELRPDTGYQIRVRAFTMAGKGAWSDRFLGRTLPSLETFIQRPYMLIVAKDSLFRSDLDGKFKQQLLSKSKFDQLSSVNAIELYDELIVLNTDENILAYNQSSCQMLNDCRMKTVVNGSRAHSVAVEWMAAKIYWSNPSERMICRCNMDGSQMEILPMITYARELAIDSVHGFLYWSTSDSLRISLLNGMQHSQKRLFENQSIKSLSLDANQAKLYWTTLVQSGTFLLEGERESMLVLNQMSLFQTLSQVLELDPSKPNIKIESYPLAKSANLLGPVAMFAGRFWWLNHDIRRIVISDHSVGTLATIPQIDDVKAFKVVMNDAHNHLGQSYGIFDDSGGIGIAGGRVVPQPVDSKSIRILGTWENFTIQWLPVVNINYGQVYYEFQVLENENENFEHNQSEPVKPSNHLEWRFDRNVFILNSTIFLLPDHLKPAKPYSKIRISLRSFTYWASAKQVVVTLRTPSSIPSKPRSVRVFTYLMDNAVDQILNRQLMAARDQQQLQHEQLKQHQNACNEEQRFVAEARWSEPESPNGLIQSYTVSLWTVDTIAGINNERVVSIINKVVDSNQLSYKLLNLKANCTYFFDVRATTDVGEGPASDAVQVRTTRSEPPMCLLLTNRDSILQADMDLLTIRPIIQSFSPSIIGYILAENIIFFIEDGHFLKSTRFTAPGYWTVDDVADKSSQNRLGQSGESGNFSLLAHFPSTVTSMSIDWISRRLYLSTVDFLGNQSIIWWYQPETGNMQPLITVVDRQIDTVRIDPYRSMLVWTERMLWPANTEPLMVTIRRCSLSINGTVCLNVENYFQTPSRDRWCNCTHTPNISGAFLMVHPARYTEEVDHLNSQTIIYFDRNGQTFVQCNDGCYCRRITSFVDTNLPPTAIELDHQNGKLYWKNNSMDGVVYSAQLIQVSNHGHRQNQNYGHFQPTQDNVIDLAMPITNMVGLMPQPYPSQFECLLPPKDLRLNMVLVKATSTVLTLAIDLQLSPTAESVVECGPNSRLTLASILYRVCYQKKIPQNNDHVDKDNGFGQCLESYNQTLVINDLDPFTNYSFSIEMDNHYLSLMRNRTRKQLELAQNASLVLVMNSDREIERLVKMSGHRKYGHLYANGFMFATAESRPAPPSQVHATVLSPDRFLIVWNEPEKMNTQQVAYEVRWHAWFGPQSSYRQSSLNDVQSKWWQLNEDEIPSSLNASYWMYLDNISPGTLYNVTVRAYAINRQAFTDLHGYSVDYNHFQDSETIMVKSYDEPDQLQPARLATRQMDLVWNSPIDPIIEFHELWYELQPDEADWQWKKEQALESEKNSSKWIKFIRDQTKPAHKYRFELKQLKPYSWYRFRMIVIYRPSRIHYEWPKQPKQFRLQTKMTVPDGPDSIEIETIRGREVDPQLATMQHHYWDRHENLLATQTMAAAAAAASSSSVTAGYKIKWNSVRSNAACSVYYQLYGWPLVAAKLPSENVINVSSKQLDELTDTVEQQAQWILFYNGSETEWIVTELKVGVQYHFRLYASNCLGMNEREWAQTGRPFWLGQPEANDVQYRLYASMSSGESHIFMVIFAIFSAVALCLVVFSLCSLRFYKLHAKQMDSSSCNTAMINSDLNSRSDAQQHHQMELIPWQQRPQPHLDNMLYVNSNSEEMDLSDIEVFDYRSITLVKLLGRGAFGEVHEAILHKTQQRVAVKVLNKNCSKDEENSNFLKEAKFMSKFKHPHILQLLGVCLNHHSSCTVIVLELMEAGDLLKFLRANRPQSNAKHHQSMAATGHSPLTIDDLISICIDVAKGCEYLEQKQFVHRDLAARNCLVSNVDPSKRIVKIADFGLSRGLYQQNYYRKEGGLMPVRWMSPESLSDGVFTTQSDVWSFSVIMYEVMTLGQQPYQAYSNKEVLEYVKCGGTLERPKLCPFQMYSLMKQCWSFEKEARPTFVQVLQRLQQIKEQIRRELDQEKSNNYKEKHQPQHQHQLQPKPQLQQPGRFTTVHNQNYQTLLMLGQEEKNVQANGLPIRENQKIYCNARNSLDSDYRLATSIGYSAASTTMTSLEDHQSDDHHQSDCLSLPPRLLTMSPTLVLHNQAITDIVDPSKTEMCSGGMPESTEAETTMFELNAINEIIMEGYQLPIR